jgi:hypothetical protein
MRTRATPANLDLVETGIWDRPRLLTKDDPASIMPASTMAVFVLSIGIGFVDSSRHYWTASGAKRMMSHRMIWWARCIVQMEEPDDVFGTFSLCAPHTMPR